MSKHLQVNEYEPKTRLEVSIVQTGGTLEGGTEHDIVGEIEIELYDDRVEVTVRRTDEAEVGEVQVTVV